MAKPKAPRIWTNPELNAIAVKWLKRPASGAGPGCEFALSEARSGYSGEIPDAIGFRFDNNDVTTVVVEVKVTRSDFLADRNKPHRASGGLGVYRYYLCPEGLIKVTDLPAGWGLLWVNSRGHIKPMAGPACLAGGRYDEYTKSLEDWALPSDKNREVWMLAKLFSQLGDQEAMNKARREVYKECAYLRAVANNHLADKNRLEKRCRELGNENWRLANPEKVTEKAIPRVSTEQCSL